MDDKEIRSYFIVNPNSAGGATMKQWPRTSEKVERMIGKFDYDFTDAAGVATLLTGEAISNGYDRIIAVGGDGTLHEVIQGLFNNGELINPDITVGTLPLGSGTDFARTLKTSNDIDEAIVRLRGNKAKMIDLALVTYKDHKGGEGTRYLINMADVGLGGEVAERANNSSKVFGGFATYLYSSFISFVNYKPKMMKITVDGKAFEQKVTSVFIANGEYCGGGMHIAPPAEIDDGFLNIVILKEFSKWDLVSLTPKIYSGKILTMPGVKQLTAKHIIIESDEDVMINIDGEQPGLAPVTFKILPKAVRFKV